MEWNGCYLKHRSLSLFNFDSHIMETRILATVFLKALLKYYLDDRKNWYRLDYEGSLFL